MLFDESRQHFTNHIKVKTMLYISYLQTSDIISISKDKTFLHKLIIFVYILL